MTSNYSQNKVKPCDKGQFPGNQSIFYNEVLLYVSTYLFLSLHA